MPATLLKSEPADGVMLLTLNRPDARNALNSPLAGKLLAALAELRADSHWRACVLTGSGSSFCAGLDLKEFSDPTRSRAHIADSICAVSEAGKPIIAAVNGPAITGGLELALRCDFILAGESAVFADTHAMLGAFSGTGLASLLSEAVGTRWASQAMLTGEKIDAPTALRIGLVNEIVDDRALPERACQVATRIAAAPRSVSDVARRTLKVAASHTLAGKLHAEHQIIQAYKSAKAG